MWIIYHLVIQPNFVWDFPVIHMLMTKGTFEMLHMLIGMFWHIRTDSTLCGLILSLMLWLASKNKWLFYANLISVLRVTHKPINRIMHTYTTWCNLAAALPWILLLHGYNLSYLVKSDCNSTLLRSWCRYINSWFSYLHVIEEPWPSRCWLLETSSK